MEVADRNHYRCIVITTVCRVDSVESSRSLSQLYSETVGAIKLRLRLLNCSIVGSMFLFVYYLNSANLFKSPPRFFVNSILKFVFSAQFDSVDPFH